MEEVLHLQQMAKRGRGEPQHSHFFKVIFPATLQDKKLRIPEKFVMKYGDELSDVATLMVPNGRVWKVQLIKEGRKIWFDNGWYDFVKYYSIGAGHFLVFKFGENSSFHILIFDMSACEINYPSYSCHGEKENEKQNFVHQEILGSTNPISPFSTLESKVKTPSGQIFSPSQQNQDKSDSDNVLGINRSQRGTASLKSSRYEQVHEPQIKKCKIEEMVINESWRAKMKTNEMNNSHYDEDEKPKVDAAENELKRSEIDKQKFMTLLEEMGISVSESFIHFTVEQRHRALHAARLFRPKNPTFLVILRLDHIKSGYTYVPSKFVRKCLSKDIKSIEIHDGDGREWAVNVKWHNRGCIIRGGWSGFVKDKNLKRGDICVFELIKKDFVLKISVLHHSQDSSAQDEHEGEMRFRFYESASAKKRMATAEERERAINAAKSFEPTNPFCRVVLRPSYLYRGCIMYLPSCFAEKHLNGISGFIKLQISDGKQWPVRCLYEGGRAKFSQGWYEFTLENNLGEGDVCVFEVLRVRDLVLKVSVFRILESTGFVNRLPQ